MTNQQTPQRRNWREIIRDNAASNKIKIIYPSHVVAIILNDPSIAQKVSSLSNGSPSIEAITTAASKFLNESVSGRRLQFDPGFHSTADSILARWESNLHATDIGLLSLFLIDNAMYWPFLHSLPDNTKFIAAIRHAAKNPASHAAALISATDVQSDPAQIDIAERIESAIPLQSHVSDEIANLVTLHLAGMIGVTGSNAITTAFLIAGDEHCGVPTLANAIAEIQLAANPIDSKAKPTGMKQRVLEIDGSAYALEHATSLLLGAFNEYKNTDHGGQLSNFLPLPGRKVVIVHNIAQANATVQNAIAGILLGHSTQTNHGKKPYNAPDTIFIFTAPDLHKKAEDDTGDRTEMENVLRASITNALTPSLLSALSGVFLFRPDPNSAPNHLIDLRLEQAAKELKRKGITLHITPKLKSYLEGEFEAYIKENRVKADADSVKIFLNQTIFVKIAAGIISGEIKSGQKITPGTNREGLYVIEPTIKIAQRSNSLKGGLDSSRGIGNPGNRARQTRPPHGGHPGRTIG